MSSKQFHIVLGSLLALAIGIFLWGYIIWNPLLPEEMLPPETQSKLKLSKPIISRADPVRGDPKAPLAIVEFGDYLCPFCAELEPTLKELLEANKGKIKLVWKDMPNVRMHPLAEKVALAARCAGDQGKYWEYHDLLFENQQTLTNEEILLVLAKNLALNQLLFSQCLASSETKRAIDLGIAEGLALDVDGTPYFFVGGKKGTLGAEALKEAVAEALLLQTPPK